MQRYRSAYDLHFPRVDLLTQLTLAAFIAQGDYERHLRKLRTLNRKKHDLMKHAIQKYLGSTAKIVVEGGGLAILIQSDKKAFDYQKLQRLSEKAQIKIYLAKERSGGDFEAVRMGFGGFALEEIEEAVEAFAKVWERSCATY
jgi:GntR family transcriptional regulator/MocR family aminotransferase